MMSSPELFIETGVIMLLGMGIVFLFLGILILAIILMSKMVNRVELESGRGASHVTVSDSISPEVVSAIAVAIKQFKSKS